MSVFPADQYGPMACAEDCIATCRQQEAASRGFLSPLAEFFGSRFDYGLCLNDCQQGCPGGAPGYTPGLCVGDTACRWGTLGQVIVVTGQTLQDVGGLGLQVAETGVAAVGALASPAGLALLAALAGLGALLLLRG